MCITLQPELNHKTPDLKLLRLKPPPALKPSVARWSFLPRSFTSHFLLQENYAQRTEHRAYSIIFEKSCLKFNDYASKRLKRFQRCRHAKRDSQTQLTLLLPVLCNRNKTQYRTGANSGTPVRLGTPEQAAGRADELPWVFSPPLWVLSHANTLPRDAWDTGTHTGIFRAPTAPYFS